MGKRMITLQKNTARKLAQRLTFHNHVASKLAAEIMYLVSSRGDDRNAFVSKTVETFSGGGTSNWVENKKEIKDILYARAFYLTKGKEYYLYGLNVSKNPDKMKYVGWYELYEYYTLLNKMGHPEIFDQKEKTYERFKEFYHREQVYIPSSEKKNEFCSFLERHPSCILKPSEEYGGHGVEYVQVSEQKDPNSLWEEVKKRCPFVLEELIEQAPEMNAFYPHAVNTIRYNTFFHNGKLTRLQAVFRIGRGGSIVDNATSGGIYALVDTETGRILCPARSFQNEQFEKHPDTGMQFEGNYIPRWDELNALLEKVVRVIPEQKQVGWDFALSKNGWVMVEGNTTPALQSLDLNHGLRDLVRSSFGQVIHVWK